MKGERVTVANTATLIVDGGPGSSTYPVSCVIKNPTGGQIVALGGATVTFATGLELAVGESIAIDLIGDDLYGIVTSGSQSVQVLRNGA